MKLNYILQRIQFARGTSDAAAKLAGTFIPREKRKKAASKATQGAKKKAMIKAPGGGQAVPRKEDLIPPNKILFAQDLPGLKSLYMFSLFILLVDETEDEMLLALFNQYDGFKEVRMVPGQKGLAFIEFGTEAQASVALENLRDFRLSATHLLRLSYAKR